MSRIPAIESALKTAYYDNFINSDAMVKAAVKAAGVEPTMELYHQAETIISRRIAEEDQDWRAMAEEIDAMLPKSLMAEYKPKHTKGVAAIAPHGNTTLVIGKRHLAACGGYSSNLPGEDAYGENEANARRIVACWNACTGISIEALENLVEEAGSPAAESANYWKTRYQLLEAKSGKLAKELMGALEAIVASTDYGADDERPLMQQARSAIDKAKAVGVE